MKKFFVLSAISFLFSIVLVSCGGGGGGGGASPPGPLTIIGDTPPAIIYSPYSATLQGGGGYPPYTWSITAGSLPPGLVLDPNTGTIYGAPVEEGTYTFTVRITDSASPTAQYYEKQFTILVQGFTVKAGNNSPPAAGIPSVSKDVVMLQIAFVNCNPLVITTITLPDGMVGKSYSWTCTAIGGTVPYTWSLDTGSSLPAGLTLGGDGVISGIPTTSGTFTFTIKVTDSTAPTPYTATRQLSLKIVARETLTITTTTLPGASVGSPYYQQIEVTGGVTPYTFAVSAGNLPAGLTLDAATGIISGTPTTEESLAFTVTVTDSSVPTALTDDQFLTIDVVAAGGTLAVTTTSIPKGKVGVSYSWTLTATGGTLPYSWAVTTGALPDGLTLDSATGVISGIPTTGGLSPVTITLTDSAGTPNTVELQLTIEIGDVSALAITTVWLPDGMVGAPYYQQVQAVGGITPYTFGTSAGSLPAGLSLDAATGIISGTPSAVGSSNFTATVTDSSVPTALTDDQALSIEIKDANTIGSVTVTSITFKAEGSGNEQTDVENVRLYIDENNNGRLDTGTDTQLGGTQTYSADDGTITFGGLSITIAPAQTINLILVYDFTKNAWPEEGFQVKIPNNSDIVANINVAGAPIEGRLQTIRYPNWVRRTPATRDSGGASVALPVRINHDWAYDTDRNLFVMFSGAPVGFQNETWEYNGATQVWERVGTDLAPSDPAPCPRQNHAMCYMKNRQLVLVFAGRVTYQMPTYILDDTCTYQAGTWGGIMGNETATSGVFNPYNWNYYHPNPCPQRRECCALEYFDDVQVVVMYGGVRSWPGTPTEYADVWITQTNMLPTPFGSNNVQQYAAIWAQLPDSPAGTRYYHVMAYDSARQRIVMHGGFSALQTPHMRDDTWELTTGGAWNQLNPANKPSARRNHDIMYDPERDVMIIFGGATDSGTKFGDTWEFAQTERESSPDWKEMKPANKPSAREGHAMGWDVARQMPRSEYNGLYKIPDHVGRVSAGVGVLFGGENKNDTWEYLR